MITRKDYNIGGYNVRIVEDSKKSLKVNLCLKEKILILKSSNIFSALNIRSVIHFISRIILKNDKQ